MLELNMMPEPSTKNLLLLALLICGSYCSLRPNTSVAQPLEFKERARIGKLDSENQFDLFGEISAIAVGQNSELYIADKHSMQIRMFDAAGTYQLSYGRRGNGPGEYIDISAMAVDDRGRLLVLDAQRRRLTRISSNGEIETRSKVGIGYPKRIMFEGSIGYITLQGPPRAFSKDKSLFKILDDSLNIVYEFGTFDDLGIDSTGFANEILRYNPGYFDVDGEGNIIFAPFLYDGRLLKYLRGANGWEFDGFLIGNREAPSYTLTEFNMNTIGATLISMSPRNLAAFIHNQSVGIHVTDNGQIWHFSISKRGESRKLVAEQFSPDGVLEEVHVSNVDIPLFPGSRASIEVREYWNGRFYLIDHIDGFPSVRVVELDL